VVAPPTQAHDARQFIRRDNQQPAPHIDQLRQERHEVREGNRVFIREPDRTIIREGDRTIIRHNEANRFAVGARNVVVERRGVNSETIIERGNGVRIINITDADGRLIRRVRRDPGGREIVIIDNSRAWRGGGPAPLFVQLPPPVVRIPRERYILDLGLAAAAVAAPAAVYGVLMEPPVEVIDQPYTLDQVRFSAPLRDRMPRIDLDINFDTGSWQLTPDQVDRLSVIADAINRAVQANPREVFMIEGHTDAVGSDVDNLSLSDRRAEAVAVALTEQFQVPAENLVTQGYGEQYLKVPTPGPERANRRVAVRRITPLLDQQAAAAPPPR
jgi:outer membrane protein OmpA-like peptidoglycan-associated protein